MLKHAARARWVLCALIVGLLMCGGPAQAQPANAPPPAVEVVTVPVRNVAPSYSFIGHVQAIQSVQIVARVTAFIEQEPVQQGADVKAGTTLFVLQKAQYAAAVQAAKAQLDSANAALHQAQLAYERALQLSKQGVEAQANLDQATATRDQDQANVLAAQANLAQAALNLSYCTIVSPIDGRIGAITLTKGNLVTPSTPPLATVNQMDPIRVVFSVSDRQLVSVKQKTGASEEQIASALALNLVLTDGSPYPYQGKITFLNNQVDPQTGTVSVYADFPNPDRLLLPGAYVSVKVRRAEPEERPMVPVAAVQTDQNGSYVLTVGPDNAVHQQPITLGRQIAQAYIVESGLKGGERVIVAGVQKVHPGQKVNPQQEKEQPVAASGAASPGDASAGEAGG